MLKNGRYQVKFEAFDTVDNALFVMEDAEMKEILGISCEDLMLIHEVCLNEHSVLVNCA